MVLGAWYKKHEECRSIAGDEEFLVPVVIVYYDKLGLMCTKEQDWIPCHLLLPFLIKNVNTMNLGMFGDTYLIWK